MDQRARWAKKRAGEVGPAPADAAAAKPAKAKKSSGYGSLKDSIIAELQKAGTAGIHVKALATKVGAKVPNITTWFFSTTAKKLRKNIVKAAPATYGWKA